MLGESVSETGHAAAQVLMSNNITTAFLVAATHTFAMTFCRCCDCDLVYTWFGLYFKSWFNLDLLWALSLITVGAFGVYSAFLGHQ